MITTTDYERFGGSINWELQSSPSTKGSIRFGGEPPTVESIVLSQDRQVTFQNVIDIYGEPSHILAQTSPCVDQDCAVYRLTITYIEDGFALNLAGSAHIKPDFDASWRDFNLLFFEPTLQGFSEAWGNLNVFVALTPWRGMLGFDAYCEIPHCIITP